MKLTIHTSMEFKNTSIHSAQSFNINHRAQMIAPGASCCTLGCSSSCSCGTTKKPQ